MDQINSHDICPARRRGKLRTMAIRQCSAGELERQGAVRSVIGNDGALALEAVEMPADELDKAIRLAAAALRAA
jgi:hypothetical protein